MGIDADVEWVGIAEIDHAIYNKDRRPFDECGVKSFKDRASNQWRYETKDGVVFSTGHAAYQHAAKLFEQKEWDELMEAKSDA